MADADDVAIDELDPHEFDDAVPGLAALVIDAVDSGASVKFMAGATL